MKLNKTVFFPTLIIILILVVAVSLFLSPIQGIVDSLYDSLSSDLRWFFVAVDLICVIFVLWAVFGPYAKVRLGGPNAKPRYKNFTWAAMMFTTSCSAGLILFGFIEPLYYIQSPPFEITPYSDTAYETAEIYAHYHWGISAWALYVPAAIAIGILMFNMHRKRVSISQACEPVLKSKSTGLLAKLIDIVSTFGVVVAPVTSMGLGLPLVILLVQSLFNIPTEYTQQTQIAILILWIILFGTSVFLGLEKGIKNLSNLNVIIAFIFMIIVGLLAGLFQVFQAELNSLGLYISNFIRMATYTDPYGSGEFVSSWTVWYWAWLTVYMPLMGVITAKVSEGRTVREIAIGLGIICSLGCFFCIATLGNYTIDLQKSGIDIASILANDGQAAAILAIIKSMPYPEISMAILALLCFIFMATTVDTSSLVAAELTSFHDASAEEAPRSLRLIWAAVACVITFVLLQVGGFSAVQTLALLVGLPLAILQIVIIVSAVKLLRQNSKLQPKNKEKNILQE